MSDDNSIIYQFEYLEFKLVQFMYMCTNIDELKDQIMKYVTTPPYLTF